MAMTHGLPSGLGQVLQPIDPSLLARPGFAPLAVTGALAPAMGAAGDGQAPDPAQDKRKMRAARWSSHGRASSLTDEPCGRAMVACPPGGPDATGHGRGAKSWRTRRDLGCLSLLADAVQARGSDQLWVAANRPLSV